VNSKSTFPRSCLFFGLLLFFLPPLVTPRRFLNPCFSLLGRDSLLFQGQPIFSRLGPTSLPLQEPCFAARRDVNFFLRKTPQKSHHLRLSPPPASRTISQRLVSQYSFGSLSTKLFGFLLQTRLKKTIHSPTKARQTFFWC